MTHLTFYIYFILFFLAPGAVVQPLVGAEIVFINHIFLCSQLREQANQMKVCEQQQQQQQQNRLNSRNLIKLLTRVRPVKNELQSV
jgi:hypothetical protein